MNDRAQHLHKATVTSVSPLKVQLHDGSTDDAESFYNALYTPAEGDVVAVSYYDVSATSTALFVHGKVAGP